LKQRIGLRCTIHPLSPADTAEYIQHRLTVAGAEDSTRTPIFTDHAVERICVYSRGIPRVVNLVCVVDKEWSGEIANRLRQVGRYHASRTIVCAVSAGRTTLDATATITADGEPRPGEFALLRETVVVECGPGHLGYLDSIVDPLVVTDLATVVWSPHGHPEAVDALLSLAQIVLLDSVDDPDTADGLARARELSEHAYVVDLAWLRSTPWRERVAGTFDPASRREELRRISAVSVQHHPESAAAGLMFMGWLCSRLD
jgi:glucose-6-phosphate dehydrogenase assembly protein OpcA